MKTFGYTFRENAGALKHGTLQALDRISMPLPRKAP